MPVDINKINTQFLNDLDKLQEDFVKRIEQALKGGMSDIELIRLNAEIDFFEELNKSGYSIKLEQYLKNYDQIAIEVHNQAKIRGLTGIVGVTAQELDLLADAEAIFYLDKGRLYTQEFKTAIFRNLIGGEPIGNIIPSLRSIPLTDAQLTIGVTTGISRFHATATAKVFEESPNQRFLLGGPIDLKTRASCRAVLENQPKEGLTIAEIRDGAWTKLALENMNQFEHSPSEKKLVQEQGYTFINRGIWGCRHQPTPEGLDL